MGSLKLISKCFSILATGDDCCFTMYVYLIILCWKCQFETYRMLILLYHFCLLIIKTVNSLIKYSLFSWNYSLNTLNFCLNFTLAAFSELINSSTFQLLFKFQTVTPLENHYSLQLADIIIPKFTKYFLKLSYKISQRLIYSSIILPKFSILWRIAVLGLTMAFNKVRTIFLREKKIFISRLNLLQQPFIYGSPRCYLLRLFKSLRRGPASHYQTLLSKTGTLSNFTGSADYFFNFGILLNSILLT